MLKQVDRREHPHQPFHSPAPPGEHSHSLSLTTSHPSAACALLTGLAKKAALQGGSKGNWGQQTFLNFFVSVWTQQNSAACSNMDHLVLWKMGTLQRFWLYPQLCDNRVFCHLAVTLSSSPLLTGSQSLLYKDGPIWRWKCSQHP